MKIMILGNVRAIVIADDHYNGLGVIRSLGERNVPIYLILLKKGDTIIDSSKYVEETVKIKVDDEEIINAVKDFVREKNINILFPLSDYVAELIDRNRNVFGDYVVVPNAGGKLKEYQNKLALANIFEQAGIVVPKHQCLDVAHTCDCVWETYPAIIKPLVSIEGLKSDIVRVDDEQALQDALREFQRKGYRRVLVETFITGEEEHMVEILGYTDKLGNPHFSKVIRKIREYPICGGSTSYARLCERHQGVNYIMLESVVKKLNYYGIFDIEFKYADGKLYFIEMNFRNGAPAYALTRTGFNIVYEWLCDAVGQSADVLIKNNKEFFMCEQRDILNLLKKNVGVCCWIRQFGGAQKIVWDIHDIKPVLMMFRELICNAMRRLCRVHTSL